MNVVSFSKHLQLHFKFVQVSLQFILNIIASISLIFYLAGAGENPSEQHYRQHDFHNHFILVTPLLRNLGGGGGGGGGGGNHGQTSFGIFCTSI